MKLFFPNFVKVLLLAVAVGAATGCENTANSQKGPIDETAVPVSPRTGPSAADKGSAYPRIASAVATAEIKDLEGATYTLNDRLGKVVLLNLWATWCGPCRTEIPALVRMQELHGPNGFEVIGLNTDEEPVEMIAEFGSGLGVNYPMAYADTSLQASLLKISKFPGIPQSFLVDREGRLRGVFKGANPADIAKMEEIVAKLVNEGSGQALPPAAEPAAEPAPAPASASAPPDPVKEEKKSRKH
ncbi:MAG: TlpA family protein disulfide reductase [Pyrinomonadaceae bacterium]